MIADPGANARRGGIDGVTISRRWYARGCEMRPHAHDDAGISFVIAGSVQEWAHLPAGAERHVAAFGAAVVKPAGVVHSNCFGPRGAHLVSIEFEPPAVSNACCNAAAVLARDLLAHPELYRWTRNHLLALSGLRLLGALSGPPGALRPALADVLSDLRRRLDRSQHLSEGRGNSVPPWIHRAMMRLHEATANRLSVRQLGLELGVHPVSLARGFQRVHGCAVSQYRQRLQIVRAASRLAETNLAPARIAVEAGFADQAHLCRAFQRHVGMSPGRFRACIAPPAH